jgi:hypothetical protein
MPTVNNVGEPCAGEPHARFDGRVLETGRLGLNAGSVGQRLPRQHSTLPGRVSYCAVLGPDRRDRVPLL